MNKDIMYVDLDRGLACDYAVCRVSIMTYLLLTCEIKQHHMFIYILYLKPQSHIHDFCPGRATVHPDLASR